MKKLLMLLAFAAVLFAGCAKMRDQMAADGGVVASLTGGSQGDYIVISQSGGEIMDVWKLSSSIVQSATGSDGWLFRDNDGNPVNLGGDVKVIRVIKSKSRIWDRYHEYHMELESKSYRELYQKKD